MVRLLAIRNTLPGGRRACCAIDRWMRLRAASVCTPAREKRLPIANRPSFSFFRFDLPCGLQFDVSGERRKPCVFMRPLLFAGANYRFPPPLTVIAMLAIHGRDAIIDSNLDGGTYGKSTGA